MSYRYDATVAFVSGLAALIFSTQFFPIEHDLTWAIILVVGGLIGLVYGIWRWSNY